MSYRRVAALHLLQESEGFAEFIRGFDFGEAREAAIQQDGEVSGVSLAYVHVIRPPLFCVSHDS